MVTVEKYYANWCGPCKALHTSLTFLQKNNPGVFEIVDINIEDEPARAQKAGVKAVPFVIVKDSLGLQIAQFYGAETLGNLRKLLFPNGTSNNKEDLNDEIGF